MKKYFDYVKKDRLVMRLFISAFLFLGLTLIFTLLNYPKLPPLLPVFNQLPWGADRLSSTLGIFIPSILVLMISLVNLLLCGYIYSNSPLLSRIFAFTTFLISLLNLLFIIRTILLIS